MNVRTYIDGVNAATRTASKEPFVFVIVGNKNDIENERQVFEREGKALATSLGCAFIETSAKSRQNIDEAFRLFAQETWKKYPERRQGIADEHKKHRVLEGMAALEERQRRVNPPRGSLERLKRFFGAEKYR